MANTIREVMELIQENDVKFIRLSFVDLVGQHKNISIMPDELKMAFHSGIGFDASAIRGFSDVVSSDLFLYPDPDTFILLPWRPGGGRVARLFCDVKTPAGIPFACDCRHILRSTVQQADELGFQLQIGAECEFYLFKTDDMGRPTDEPFDRGGYLDIAPLDKCEDVRREICLNLEEIGIQPESSHHEQGPGQNEIDFRYGDVLQTADNFISFKSVVKGIAARSGVYASFMPKPINNASGSGTHINLSMQRQGQNIFHSIAPENKGAPEQFIAGILKHIGDITAFLNPTVNSYQRLGRLEAPGYVSWSHQNRSQLIRIPAAAGQRSRMELRSPDPAANPYLAFALIIRAGLDGIRHGLELAEPCDLDLYEASDKEIAGLERLPASLSEAVDRARGSEFLRTALDHQVLQRYFDLKTAEIRAYETANHKNTFIRENYFEVL